MNTYVVAPLWNRLSEMVLMSPTTYSLYKVKYVKLFVNYPCNFLSGGATVARKVKRWPADLANPSSIPL